MLRFTIRDMLWLKVVVAFAVAWRVEVGRIKRAHAVETDWYHRQLLDKNSQVYQTVTALIRERDQLVKQRDELEKAGAGVAK